MSILSFFRRQKASAPRSTSQDVATPGAQNDSQTAAAAPREAERIPAALLEPLITEKAALLSERGEYTFRIGPSATKQDVRRAVEGHYRVHVRSVNVITVGPKTRTRGRILGHVPGYRKAIVALREGERIDLTKAVS